MLTLYHVSVDNKPKISKLFIPKVPETCAKWENKDIKRICFSTSIEKCLIATQSLNLILSDYVINVYKFIVNEDDENLKDPEYVYYEGGVKDALGNEEYWYLKPLELSCESFKVKNINYEIAIEFKNISIKEIKELLSENQLFDSIISQEYKTSKEYYNEAMKLLESTDNFITQDWLYDSIVDRFTWCQSWKINKLELQKI